MNHSVLGGRGRQSHQWPAAYENVIWNAQKARGSDSEGYRTEFIKLVETAKAPARAGKTPPRDS